MSIRHRLFAALYDRMNAAAERRWMGKRWANLLADAHGAVLEIGGGTGANLDHDLFPRHGGDCCLARNTRKTAARLVM
jgi:hypothetical protein